MPMPFPRRGESEDDFINRFMANDAMIRDFPDRSQRFAIAKREFRKRRNRKD